MTSLNFNSGISAIKKRGENHTHIHTEHSTATTIFALSLEKNHILKVAHIFAMAVPLLSSVNRTLGTYVADGRDGRRER